MTILTHNTESTIAKSSQKLLHTLGLQSALVCAPDSLQHGLLAMLCDEDAWLQAWRECFKYVDKQAIFVDEESFVAASFALQKIPDCTCEILRLSDVLLAHKDALAPMLGDSLRWRDFHAAYCSSAFGNFCDRAHDFALLELLGLQTEHTRYESVAHIAAFNPESALCENARVYYAMVDCGIDVIVSSAWSTFSFFEKQAKKMQQCAGRGTLDVPILHLSEVALIAIGQAVTPHKIPLEML